MTFNKDYLYDGPWRVLWKTNTAWQKYFDPLNNVADNRAYQWYKEVSQREAREERDALKSRFVRCCLDGAHPTLWYDWRVVFAAEACRSRGRDYTRATHLGKIARFYFEVFTDTTAVA